MGKSTAKRRGGGGDYLRSEVDPSSSSVGDRQKKDHDSLMFKRQRGESLKAYLERIDIESNARIMEAYRKSRGKSERRKRYGTCTLYIDYMYRMHVYIILSKIIYKAGMAVPLALCTRFFVFGML